MLRSFGDNFGRRLSSALALRPLAVALAMVALSAAAQTPRGNEFTNSIGMRLLRIKPGSFRMGFGDTPVPNEIAVKSWREKGDFDEHPAHPVTISEPFFYGSLTDPPARFSRR